jgi:hypothetical protein
MKLDSVDLEILEAAFYDEPWHILCGMVADQFNDIRELIPRIFQLQKKGLIEILRDPGTIIDPTPQDLERIAINHAVYGTTSWPEGSTWSIKTTEEGFKYIKDRFE